jgi:CRISPR-associated endonuclease/helicase Cas3
VVAVREAIVKALELFEKKRGRIIVELPTGYGKTTAGAEVYRLLSRGVVYPEDRVIHVLPLRAIVEDLAIRLSETLGADKVAYQAGIVIQGVNKEPFFDADYTVTTLDSFAHNMFKFPITELYKTRRHYYIPLTRIFTAGVVFDESHLFIGGGKKEKAGTGFLTTSKKMGTAFLTGVKILARMGNPVIIMSATLTSSMERELRERLGDGAVVVKLGSEDKNTEEEVVVRDDDFTSAVGCIDYNLDVIGMGDVVNKAVEYLRSRRRVLVIIDNREETIRVYNELRSRGFRAGLVHSWLTRRERWNVISNLGGYEVLVGTSSIEAGVDVSFDVLITTPTSALSLVQRVGRVCRWVDKPCKPCVGDVLLIGDFEGNREGLVDYVRKKQVCWRLPFNHGDCVGYNELLETFDEPLDVDRAYENELENLFNYMYISEDILDRFFMEKRYSLVREPLVEVYARGVETFKSTSYEDALLDSFTIEYARDTLSKIAKCVEGLGVVSKDGTVVINDGELLRGFARGDYWSFARFIKNHVINKRAVGPFVILRPSCLGSNGGNV